MAKRTAGPRCRRADGLKQMYFTGSLQCAFGAKRNFRLSAGREVRRKKTYCRTTIPAARCAPCPCRVWQLVASMTRESAKVTRRSVLVVGLGSSEVWYADCRCSTSVPLCRALILPCARCSAPCPCHMPSQIEALQLLMMIALASSFWL